MIVNLNVRVLTNGAIFVQYQEDGKAKDAAFMSWIEFVTWLSVAVGINVAIKDGSGVFKTPSGTIVPMAGIKNG